MTSELGYQRTAAYDRLEKTHFSLLEFNTSMRSRASIQCTASTILVGIVTAASFLPSKASEFSFETIILALVCACTAYMYWIAGDLWKATNAPLPGVLDAKEIYDSYIVEDIDTCYNQLLIDLSEAVSRQLAINVSIGKTIDDLTRLLQVQILLIVSAIFWRGVEPLVFQILERFAA